MLKDYINNVIFLISHFDMAQKPDLAMLSINDALKELEINNQIIYFSNYLMNKKIFSDAIYALCSNLPQIQIKIDMKVFYKYFNLKKE